MRRSEFCQNRGLSFSTRDRNLKKRRWKGRRQPVSSAGRLVPLELSAMKSPAQHEPSCGLAVLLPSGLRIEVHPNFDTNFRTPGRCSGAEISRVWTGSSHTDLSCRRSHRHAQGVRGALRSCPRRLSYDPLSGHLFLFCNAQRNRSPRGGPKFAAILPTPLFQMPIPRAEAQTSTLAKLAPPHTAPHEFRHQSLNFSARPSFGC
jgi:hypothetical protein